MRNFKEFQARIIATTSLGITLLMPYALSLSFPKPIFSSLCFSFFRFLFLSLLLLLPHSLTPSLSFLYPVPVTPSRLSSERAPPLSLPRSLQPISRSESAPLSLFKFQERKSRVRKFEKPTLCVSVLFLTTVCFSPPSPKDKSLCISTLF